MPLIVFDVYRGLVDFVKAPIRLLSLHRQCLAHAQKNAKRNNSGLREKQAERRMQLQRVYEDLNPSDTDSAIDIPGSKKLSSGGQPQMTVGLLKPLMQMWGLNASLCTVIALLMSYTPLKSVADEIYSMQIFGFLGMIFSAFCRLLLLAFTEIVTFVFLKKILDQIATLSHSLRMENSANQSSSKKKQNVGTNSAGGGQTSLPLALQKFALSASVNSAIGGSIMDRVYAMLFYTFYDLEWQILLLFLGNGGRMKTALYAFSQSLLYSCYAFEYLWRTVSGNTFEKFLASILNQWAYFLGYGAITGTLLALIPNTLGWSGLVLSLGYPLLVVGALSVPWNPTNLGSPLPYLPLAVLRLPILVSTYPALYATNFLISLSERLIRKLASTHSLSVNPSGKKTADFSGRYFQEPEKLPISRQQQQRHRSGGSIFSSLNSG